MHFQIRHTTTYRYSKRVFLEPMTIRLRPRSDVTQDLQRFALEIHPEPAGRVDFVDAAGNDASHVWFDGMHDQLEVVASSDVETTRHNPFAYLLPPGGAQLPPGYSPEEQTALSPYLARSASSAATAMAEEAAAASGGDLPRFLSGLATMIYERIRVVIREDGEPLPAEETARRGEASCRDLTVLYMEACRSMGVAVRFASGYQEGDTEQERRDMHAWPEAYLPGNGWRGFDPTLGLAVADAHVLVAAGPSPADAAPTSGSFRGTGAGSEMASVVELVRLDGGAQRQSQH